MHTVKRDRCYVSSVIKIQINRLHFTPIVVTFIIASLALDATAVKWLSVNQGKNIPWNDTKACKEVRKNYGLTKQQTTLCKKSSDIMPHVQEAAKLVVDTCETLFRKRRWNCSSLRKLPTIKADLDIGTKERALVHAMSTAALTFTISRGCSRSSISTCGCSSHPEDPPNGNFKWGGCGDNVDWASDFSKRFDTNQKPKKVKRAVNKTQTYTKYRTQKHKDANANNDDNEVLPDQNAILLETVNNHNGEIGRKLVSNSLAVHCKCHGVSGSCSIKTCWRGLPFKFNEIGDRVMFAYNQAVQVHTSTKPHLLTRYNEEQCLLYTNSPNYCDYNPKAGIYGLSGRECNASLNALDNCDTMCCGRGYTSRVIEYYERCNCVYHPDLFDVTCDKCKLRKIISTCK